MTAPSLIITDADIVKQRDRIATVRGEGRLGGVVSRDQIPPAGPVRPAKGILFP